MAHRWLLGVCLAALVAGCGKKKSADDERIPCRSDDDCPEELVCSRYECVTEEVKEKQRGRPGRSNNVTPEGVKREVDGISRDYERQVDKSLDE